MNWTEVKIKTSRISKEKPSVSVGIGRITLNSAACDLIENFEEYTHAKFMKSQDRGVICIGIKFLKEEQENSIKINKRKYNGKIVENSCSFNNQNLAKGLFGAQGEHKTMKSYEAVLDNEDKSILVISLR